MPDSVTELGEGVFAMYSSLTDIKLSKIDSLNGDNFLYCNALKTIYLPKSIQSIGGGTFSNCSELKYVVIPDGVTKIDAGTFYYCSHMSNIYIPASVTEIYNDYDNLVMDPAFEGCYFITITAPKDSYAIEFAKENNIPYVELQFDSDNEGFTGNIPSEIVDQQEENSDDLSVISNDVTAIFDIGAVIEIAHRHGNKAITFSYDVVETVDNAAQQAAIERTLENGGKLVDFSLVDADGNAIAFDASENGGTVTITVPYEAPVSANEITVYYIAPDGSRTDMNGIYDPSTKTISFTTTHFSLFSIEEVLDESELAAPVLTTTTTTTTTKPVTTTTTITAKPTTTTNTDTSIMTTSITTSTATTTSTTTTTAEAVTAATVSHIASDDDLCSWAINDYQSKTGVTASSTNLTVGADGMYVIALSDESGKLLDTYTIDPETGIGTDSANGEVNLPQTGNNSLNNILLVLGAFMMIGFGIFAVKTSGFNRRRGDDESGT